MNPCCSLHAKIIQSANPLVSWRVICSYCGEILHVQMLEDEE